ncbi:MAG: DUF4421 family protein [Flammeovirgaceae bacterium]|jgi:hypothetical protein|nr:DUF4421 family protein [Flammeovirgaceae bacterium]
MLRVIALLIFCGTYLPQLQAQTDSLQNEYRQSFPDKFFLWPVLKKRQQSFEVDNKEDQIGKLNYKPNSSFNAGVGMYLFEVGVELTFAVPIDDRSTNTYGASDVRDLQSNFLGKNWGVDLYTQKYSGFYVANPNQGPSSPDAFIKRSDIELRNTGMNVLYSLNKEKFSLKASYNYSERQLKSAGSFIVTGTVNTFRLQADSAVLPSVNLASSASTPNFRQFRYTALSVAPGYTYTLIYKSFFLNGVLSIGPAHYWLMDTGKDGNARYDISINTFADVRVALGYNGDRIFGGMSFITQSRNIHFEEVQFANANYTFKLMVGYRFREVGILKKRATDYIPK